MQRCLKCESVSADSLIRLRFRTSKDLAIFNSASQNSVHSTRRDYGEKVVRSCSAYRVVSCRSSSTECQRGVAGCLNGYGRWKSEVYSVFRYGMECSSRSK